jgi:hypothetical protein
MIKQPGKSSLNGLKKLEWYIMLQAFFFLERKSQEYVIKIILGPGMVEYLNNTHQKNRNYHSFFIFYFSIVTAY